MRQSIRRCVCISKPNVVLVVLSFPSEQVKVGGNASGGSFEDVLSSAAQASAQDTGPTASTNNLKETNEC